MINKLLLIFLRNWPLHCKRWKVPLRSEAQEKRERVAGTGRVGLGRDGEGTGRGWDGMGRDGGLFAMHLRGSSE